MTRPEVRRGVASNGPLPVERFFQFSLLGLVASGYLAVAGSAYLDLPTVFLTGLGILLRALTLGGVLRFNLSDRAASFTALAYSGFFPVDYFFFSHDFLAATVHLVFFLAVLKLLTAKTNRDNLYIAVIAFLELLAAAILSININFFLCLALFLLFAIAALTSGEIRRSMHAQSTTIARSGSKRFHSRLAWLGAWIALGILSLTAGMFFLLPRTADAALSHFISHRIRIPGFSDHVTLGEIGEFKSSSRTVMHIAVQGNLPMGSGKWRGGVLIDFDGRAWSNNERPGRVARDLRIERGRVNLAGYVHGPQRSYYVEMNDVDSRALFFAGTPEQVEGLPGLTLQETEGGTYRLRRIPPSPFRYYALSALEDAPEDARIVNPPPILDLSRRVEYLDLPPDTDRRIGELAKRMAAGATSDLARARAVEQGLRSTYGYTLELPKREPADPLADFLFVRRKGHCEYFASAMAVMLRTIGIPSRLVTGFQSGVYNSISELWMIRASDAHSWVEAWIPGRGWTTFDPTPPDMSTRSFSLFSRLSLYLDAAETFWEQWVVGYDLGHQGNLAERVELAARRMGMGWFDSLADSPSHWADGAKVWLRLYGVRLLFVIVLALWLWYGAPRLYRVLSVRRRVQRVRRGQASVADATMLYERMLQILKRQGYQKPVWFTPTEFARSLPSTQLGESVEEFTAAYNAIRFGGHTEAAPQLSILLDELERAGKRT